MVAVTQVYLGLTFAATTGASASAPAPQRLSAILTTRGNRPITVNGASAASGATILTGATIETPDNVSAVIDLGDAGVVELQPNSTIQLDFDANGNVRVKQIKGCAVVRRKANVLPDATSEIYTDQASEKTDKNRKQLGFCLLPNGTLGPLGAGAGAGGGLSGGALAAIVIGGAGGAIVIGLALRGNNPSSSTP
jgi:hypothetical protein